MSPTIDGHGAGDAGAVDIASPTNPRIKALVRLRKRRERDATGTFVVEGHRELDRALRAGIDIREIYVAPAIADPSAWRGRGAPVVTVSEEAFARAAYRRHPDGVLGVAHGFPVDLARVDTAGTPLLLVVEAIEKPGNLGTMLRTADGAGAAVIVTDPATDVFNPNVVRASQGAVFSVPVAVAPVDDAVAWLDERAIRVVAADPEGGAPYWEADLVGPAAVVIGAEDGGLSRAWDRAGVARVAIPMAPGASDSLNAAMAAGILLFEAVRQRSTKP